MSLMITHSYHKLRQAFISRIQFAITHTGDRPESVVFLLLLVYIYVVLSDTATVALTNIV